MTNDLAVVEDKVELASAGFISRRIGSYGCLHWTCANSQVRTMGNTTVETVEKRWSAVFLTRYPARFRGFIEEFERDDAELVDSTARAIRQSSLSQMLTRSGAYLFAWT